VTAEIKDMAMTAYSDHEKDCCTGGDDCVALVSVPFVSSAYCDMIVNR
jgi:hypothetical protein